MLDFLSRTTQVRSQCVIVAATQRGMRFLRRTEVCLDSQMDLHLTALEPAAASLCELWRLGDLGHPEQSTVEVPRRLLFSRRHSQLHVINRSERVVGHATIVPRNGTSFRIVHYYRLPTTPRTDSMSLGES